MYSKNLKNPKYIIALVLSFIIVDIILKIKNIFLNYSLKYINQKLAFFI